MVFSRENPLVSPMLNGNALNSILMKWIATDANAIKHEYSKTIPSLLIITIFNEKIDLNIKFNAIIIQ